MSNVISKTITLSSSSDLSGYLKSYNYENLKIDTSNNYLYITNTTGTEYVGLNYDAMKILYPNNTVNPIRADFSVDIYRTSSASLASSTVYFKLLFGSTEVSSYSYSTKNTWAEKSSSNLTNSAILNSTRNSEIKFGLSTSNSNRTARARDITLTLYYNEYTFMSLGSNTITSVSKSTGFDGDIICFSVDGIFDHYKFDGWYNGDGVKVSSEIKYYHTVNGSDLVLTAKATLNKSYKFKYSGEWETALDTYVKVPMVTMKNIINPDSFTLSNVTVSNGIYTFAAGTVAMINQSLPTPTVGHKYYGRCMQKCVSGTSFADGRFEYFVADAYGTGNVVFSSAGETTMDNAWHLYSSIETFTGLYSQSGYILRSFTVNGTNPFYRKEMMIIDLTEAFGSGNEPTKEWCDTNISYFTGNHSIFAFGTNIQSSWVSPKSAYLKSNDSWLQIY